MKHLKKTAHHWWLPPRKATKSTDDRSVSFLELFYDLAYVAIIAELTHTLVGTDLTLNSLLGFISLFALVWFAWINGTFYHELHGNNDIRTRVLTFLQMFPLAGMAIFAHSSLGEGAQGFALSYALFLAILSFLWWRTGAHDPSHRVLSQPFALAFLVTTIAFFISAFLPTPIKFYVWGGSTIFALALPLMLQIHYGKKMSVKDMEDTHRIRPSLVERFGLLTIIALGEVVVSVVRGSELGHHFTSEILISTVLALGIVIGMWWVYFDYISHRLPIQKMMHRFAWIYLHLPLTLAIALVAAGVMNALHDHQSNWLLLGGLSLFLVCVASLTHTIQFRFDKSVYRTGAWFAAISALLLIFLAAVTPLNLLMALLLSFLALLAPVCAGFYVWTRGLSQK